MIHHTYLSIGLFSLFFLFLQDQPTQPKIELESTSIDFGVIEYERDATRQITFKNIGDEPLIIHDIISECECLTVNTSLQKPFQPNEEGIITVKYDIKQGGKISTRLRLKINSSSTSIIYIRGFVIKKDATGEPIDTLKLKPLDNPSKLKSQSYYESMIIDYGIVEENSNPYRKLFFENIGDLPLVIRNLKSSCGCLVGSISPRSILLPNKKGIITARYDTKRVGQINKTLTLNTNAGRTVIRIRGRVIKKKEIEKPIDTLKLKPQPTAEKSIISRPIYLKNRSINYGVVKYRGNPIRKIIFKNTGKVPLIIQNLKSSCGCITGSYKPKTPLQPNETGTITIRYDTKRIGPINKSLTLITNAGRLIIRVKGWVMGKEATREDIDTIKFVFQEIETGPKIRFENWNINFGIMPPDSTIFRTIKFKNIGQKPLKITTIENRKNKNKDTFHSILPYKKTILPNETGEIMIQYNPKNLGKFSRYIIITTNELKLDYFNKYEYRTHWININGYVRK